LRGTVSAAVRIVNPTARPTDGIQPRTALVGAVSRPDLWDGIPASQPSHFHFAAEPADEVAVSSSRPSSRTSGPAASRRHGETGQIFSGRQEAAFYGSPDGWRYASHAPNFAAGARI